MLRRLLCGQIILLFVLFSVGVTLPELANATKQHRLSFHLESQVSKGHISIGDKPSDTITIVLKDPDTNKTMNPKDDPKYFSDYLKGKKVTISANLFGPLAKVPTKQQPKAPAGTLVFDKATAVIALDDYDANGQWKVTLKSTKSITTPGYYIWQESATPLQSSDGNVLIYGSTSSYGRTSEMFSAWTSKVISKISATHVVANSKTAINDWWKVSGILPVPGTSFPKMELTPSWAVLPVKAKLSGNAACTGQDWSKAKIVTLPNITISGNAEGNLDKVSLPANTKPGCVSFGYTLTGKDAKGKVLWTVNHPLGEATQTAVITKPNIKIINSGIPNGGATNLLFLTAALSLGMGIAATYTVRHIIR